MSDNPSIIQISRLERIFVKRKLFWQTINSILHKQQLGFVGYNWGASTFIPTSILIDYYTNKIKNNFHSIVAYEAEEIGYNAALLYTIQTLSAWRYSLGCYTINDYVLKSISNCNAGACINVQRLNNIHEWTIYIPINLLSILNKDTFGVYIHKCSYFGSDSFNNPNNLIISFNFGTNGFETSYTPLPYVLIDITSDSCDLFGRIINFWGLSYEDFSRVLPLIFSLLNVIGDEQTVIESEIVGVKRPHYTDVEININFNDLNIPTFKLAAPSNIRNWKVGSNYMTDYKQLQRLYPGSPIRDLHWENADDLMLIHPKLDTSSLM